MTGNDTRPPSCVGALLAQLDAGHSVLAGGPGAVRVDEHAVADLGR